MKLNRDIFHDFFYSAKTEQKGRANVHYTGRHDANRVSVQ